ncbi:MAG: rhomboid family intramembrane serine protease [Archangium sp.]|nr:rhomboid family intramembrane serine protease [Archangium sp.]
MFFFLPTGSTAETSRKPVVTIVIAALCVALFVWTGLVENQPPPQFTFAEAQTFADDKPYLVDDDYEGELPAPDVLAAQRKEFEMLVVRGLDRAGGVERKLSLVPTRGFAQVGWLTNLFVHFDIFHLLGNMLFLWLVGPLLEEAWGRRRFLAFYLSAGLVASLVQFLISRDSPASIGGASGAIAGCMGAFALRFAATKIRFHYFLWFIRIFVGSVHVPAWICGVLWFGRELFDLKDGGASGVATGAHVGGFMLGGLVALGMRALGSEKALLTVAESGEQRAQREGLLADASAALSRGDAEVARERLIELQQEAPDYPGAALLMAEADVLTRRGVARLERVLRPMLPKKADRTLEVTLTRLWPSVDAKAFSQAFAWQLVERLRASRPAVAPEMVESLIEAVAAGTGALAIKARALLEPEREAPPAPVAAVGPKVIAVALVAATREGLELAVDGVAKRVPFERVVAVHGGIVARSLWVDLVLESGAGARMALRLSGTDAGVPALFPGQPVPEAWQSFIGAIRRAAGIQPDAPPWEEHGSMEAFTLSWMTPG